VRISNTGEALPPEYEILEKKFKVFDYTKKNLIAVKQRRIGNAQTVLDKKKKSIIYFPKDSEAESLTVDAMEEKGDDIIKSALNDVSGSQDQSESEKDTQ
jgi:hypothetical protein